MRELEEAGTVADDEERTARRAAHREWAHMTVKRALAEQHARERGEFVPIRVPELDANGVPKLIIG